MAIAYLNGSWQPIEKAQVPVLDKGFMFGDGVYEVIPVYQSKPFAVEAHLTRLSKSLGAMRIPVPMSEEDWLTLFRVGISKADLTAAIIYVQVTRGVADVRSHVYGDSNPTVLITISPKPPTKSKRKFSLVVKEDFRWSRGYIKTISLAANTLVRNEAIAEGYDHAVLTRNGILTEASSSNVFIVKDGVIATPVANNYLLHGVTRSQVLNLARTEGLRFEERDIYLEELLEADEVWITATTIEIQPVHRINDQIVGNGEDGPVFKKISRLFRQLVCQST